MKLREILLTGTLIRLCYHLSLQSIFLELKQCHSLKAVLLDPWYTLPHFREICHLSRLQLDGQLGVPMQNGLRTKPVFLFAFIDRIMPSEESRSMDELFILLSIIIDLLIALQLYRLANNITNAQHLDKQWEFDLERQMNPRIHPTHAWMFDLNFGADFQEDGNKIDNECKSDGETTYKDIHKAIDDDTPKTEKKPMLTNSAMPLGCCILYYLNPMSILASSSYPTFQGVQYLLLLSIFHQITSRYCSTDKKSIQQSLDMSILFKATFCLALLTYIDIYYVTFLSPLIWCIRQNHCSTKVKQQIACKFSSLT